MTKLRYLPAEVWNRLALPDFRARFFVESFAEKLRMYTPHFYQARLMNVFTACREMLDYIAEYQADEKNSAYILMANEEIKSCWESDPVAQELLGDLAVVQALVSKAISAGDLADHSLGKLHAFCRAVVARQQDYNPALTSALADAVTGPAELTQKDRITTQIDRLTGLYVTALLNHGYSATYLFNRVAMFTREGNYGGRSFAEQFRFVTERLGNQIVQYDVYFGLHTNRPSMLLGISDEPGLEFVDQLPVDLHGVEVEKFRNTSNASVLVRSTIESTDYVSASLRTKERIDAALDAITALETNVDLSVSAHCLVMQGGANIQKCLNVDMLMAFVSSEKGITATGTKWSVYRVAQNLNEPAKDQLAQSLRYLRLARGSVSLEQKLLNLWIALESLFASFEGPVLANITQYVPPLYATFGLIRRVSYFKDLLVSNEVETAAAARSRLLNDRPKFDDSISEREIFALLRDEQLALELFNSLGDREHFKFRLFHLKAELEDNKAIAARLARSEADVMRQLRRIYFLRNRIAHRGHYRGVRPQVVTHLLDYLNITYSAIIDAAGRGESKHLYSIADLLAASKLGADVVAARVASQEPIAALEPLVLNPVI